ncbi:hypothetical protein GOODEAATRI_009542, partial [Goodea atripinnis]
FMAIQFRVAGVNMSPRSSRTRSRAFCLSLTATRGGGLTPNTALSGFFHSRSLRRRPNLLSST